MLCPHGFYCEKIFQELIDRNEKVRIGDNTIKNIRFANGTAIIVESLEYLPILLKAVKEASISKGPKIKY